MPCLIGTCRYDFGDGSRNLAAISAVARGWHSAWLAHVCSQVPAGTSRYVRRVGQVYGCLHGPCLHVTVYQITLIPHYCITWYCPSSRDRLAPDVARGCCQRRQQQGGWAAATMLPILESQGWSIKPDVRTWVLWRWILDVYGSPCSRSSRRPAHAGLSGARRRGGWRCTSCA